MNPPRVLQTLLVVVCIVNITWALNHEYPRRNRRIALSEYLVPPPPPRNHGPGRTGRYVSPQQGPQPPQLGPQPPQLGPQPPQLGPQPPQLGPQPPQLGPQPPQLGPHPPPPQPQESQGYLSRLMGWLNPFSSTAPSYLPPPPPHQAQHSIPYPIYPPLTDPRQGGPSGPHGPPHPPPYLKHPPPSDFNHHKGKNCNACNKVPWVPMQNSEYYRKEPSYDGQHNNWPHRPVEVPFDSHHAPSEEVRAPDFTHPQFGQAGPLPNPQLYPGPMPPLYKAGPFAASGPSSIEGNHFQQQASVSSEVIASNSYPRVEHGWTQTQDLAASGTQVDQDQSRDPSYHEPISSSGFDNVLDYVSHDLGPSAAHFDNTDLPSTILTSTVPSQIHYEESPLLDLTRNDDQVSANRPNIKLEQFSGDFATVTANYYAGNEQDLRQSQLESGGTTVSYISDALGLASSSLDTEYSQADTKSGERTALSSLVGGRQDHFYQAPSGPAEEPTGPVDKSLKNDSADSRSPRTGLHTGQAGTSKANGPTRSKQVQVIIPYTSQYTPLPFQPSFNEWNVDYNIERTQPRRVPALIGSNPDNYIGQESRPAANRVNGTIDVHRLQKNIDNWTIQEYSRATTVSSLLPSSSHPQLLPSKKIPDEYLTTTEPVDQDRHTGSNEIVKVYSLGGFSFNDVEHEGSASDHVEHSIKLDETVETTGSNDSRVNREQEEVAKVYPTTSKEQVYVVTPVPVRVTTQALRGHVKHDSKGETSKKATVIDSKKPKGNLDKFDAIERAYQVLPEAVNNLAIASTGKEDLPLWGIMEHEEFAGLGQFDEEQFDKDVADGPVLYSGHSKVSHARR